MLILLLIDGAGRIEMVDTTSKSIVLALAFTLNLLLMNIMTGGIVHEIHWPSHKLLSEERQSSHDWRLLRKFGNFMSEAAQFCGISFAGRRYKDLITLHVTSRFVMFAMADLPGEIWDKEQAVTKEADGIVQGLGGRERLMTTFVGHDPETSTHGAVHKGIYAPQDKSEWVTWNVLWRKELVEQSKDGAQHEYVSSHVVKSSGWRTDEAMCWDGIAKLLYREVRNLEFVTVGI